MGRWRPLPQDVRPEVRRLVERLRLLKDRSGLSYTALAAKTPYSASSWQRYLSAVTLPRGRRSKHSRSSRGPNAACWSG